MDLEVFKCGCVYFFNKNKYIEDEKLDDSIDARDMYEFNPNVRRWVDNLQGKEVTPISDTIGIVQGYHDIPISINWCEEYLEF